MFILLFTIHYYLLFYYYLLFITSYYYYYYLLFIAIYIVIVIYVIVIVLHSMQKSSWRLWDIGSVVKEVGEVVGLDILKVISNLNDSMFLWKNIKQQIEKKEKSSYVCRSCPWYLTEPRPLIQNVQGKQTKSPNTFTSCSNTEVVFFMTQLSVMSFQCIFFEDRNLFSIFSPHEKLLKHISLKLTKKPRREENDIFWQFLKTAKGKYH